MLPTAPALTLHDAQQQAWLAMAPPPDTILQALGLVDAQAAHARRAFEAGQELQAQKSLEDTLLQLLVAFKMLDISPEAALARALARQEKPAQAFYIYPDKVEIWANQEMRGTWPLFGEEDYQAALRVAQELGCEIIHTDSQQLALFS